MIDICWLAQSGSAAAVDVIQGALQLTQDTIASWNETWIQTISPESQLWINIVAFARGLLGLAFIYMFIRYSNDIAKSRQFSTVVELLTFPLVIVLFLGGNGKLLADIILFFRSLGYRLVTGLLSQQLVGYTMEDAIRQFGLNNLGVQRIKQVYSECAGLTGTPFQECWNSKAAEVEAIYTNLQLQNGTIDLGPLASFAQAMINRTGIAAIQDAGTLASGALSGNLNGAFASILQDRLMPIIQSVLYAVQWAFVNIVEASLLIAAVMAPIALALSVLPVAGRPIWAWASGFIGLMGLQISYNLLVGIVAVVLVNTQGGALEVSQNLGFLMFIAIFAPALTTAIASFSATNLFTAISRRANGVASTLTGGIATVTKFAVLRK
jgi:hypothetical protein